MTTSRRIDLTDKLFGYLKVIKYSYTENKRAYWECICVCGTLKIIRGSHLSAGKIISCGCKTNEILSNKNRKLDPKIASARKIYLSNYNDGDLSFEDFMNLTKLPCNYCGHLPDNIYNRFLKSTTVEKVIAAGDFIYNGLDRLDPFKPHDLNNVITCCSICNYAKLQMSISEFKMWLLQISSNYLFNLDVEELKEAVLLYKQLKISEKL